VAVKVLDNNDNPPRFSVVNASYNITVREDVAPRTVPISPRRPQTTSGLPPYAQQNPRPTFIAEYFRFYGSRSKHDPETISDF